MPRPSFAFFAKEGGEPATTHSARTVRIECDHDAVNFREAIPG